MEFKNRFIKNILIIVGILYIFADAKAYSALAKSEIKIFGRIGSISRTKIELQTKSGITYVIDRSLIEQKKFYSNSEITVKMTFSQLVSAMNEKKISTGKLVGEKVVHSSTDEKLLSQQR